MAQVDIFPAMVEIFDRTRPTNLPDTIERPICGEHFESCGTIGPFWATMAALMLLPSILFLGNRAVRRVARCCARGSSGASSAAGGSTDLGRSHAHGQASGDGAPTPSQPKSATAKMEATLLAASKAGEAVRLRVCGVALQLGWALTIVGMAPVLIGSLNLGICTGLNNLNGNDMMLLACVPPGIAMMMMALMPTDELLINLVWTRPPPHLII